MTVRGENVMRAKGGAVASRRAVVAGLGVAVVATVAGCGETATSRWVGPDGAGGGSGSNASPAAPGGSVNLVVAPTADANDVPVNLPVTVTVEHGTLDSVAVANTQGKALQGALADDKLSWKSTEPLGYGKSYTVAAVAVGADGARVSKNVAFRTMKPGNVTLPYLRANPTMLLDKNTFGVGQPIVVWFDEPIKDRAAAERSLEVTASPTVSGAWHWFSDHELHWRPQAYWKPGTSVTVKAAVYGVHLGGGVYGQEDRVATFTIGPSRIAIADSNTKHMIVYIDGAMVRDIPVSMGRGGSITIKGNTIDFWTRTGVHVVMDKQEVVHMTSASYGLPKDDPSGLGYDELIKLGVHISNAGEYVHLADWNVPKHGHYNTSHGCVNVGPSHARWFYDTFGAGDVVEVKNTAKPLEPTDGLGDWTLTWAQWTAGSATR